MADIQSVVRVLSPETTDERVEVAAILPSPPRLAGTYLDACLLASEEIPRVLLLEASKQVQFLEGSPAHFGPLIANSPPQQLRPNPLRFSRDRRVERLLPQAALLEDWSHRAPG